MSLGNLPSLLDPDELDSHGLGTGLLAVQRKGDEPDCWEGGMRAPVDASLSIQTNPYGIGCQEA